MYTVHPTHVVYISLGRESEPTDPIDMQILITFSVKCDESIPARYESTVAFIFGFIRPDWKTARAGQISKCFHKKRRVAGHASS